MLPMVTATDPAAFANPHSDGRQIAGVGLGEQGKSARFSQAERSAAR